MTVRTCKPRVRAIAHITFFLVLGTLATGILAGGTAHAGSIAAVYVWPATATTNSCRWIRAHFTHAATESVHEMYLSGVNGWAPSLPPDPRGASYSTLYQPGGGTNGITTIYSRPDSGNTYITIGPFCGSYNAFGEPPADYPHVIGYLSSPGTNTTRPVNASGSWVGVSGRFVNNGTVDTNSQSAQSNTYYTVHDNDDLLEWYTPGTGGNIDPISVGPTEVVPDSGSGSNVYTFRVRYRSGLYSGLSLPPRWRTEEDLPPGGTNQGGFRAWDNRTDSLRTRSDPNNVSQFNWLYGKTTDPWLDQVGYNRDEFNDRGLTEPYVLLVIDGQHWAPHYMIPEDPENTNYANGVVYKYTILPTDYQNFLDNLFLFPFDLPGSDLWDRWPVQVTGRPTSNNYVALTSGKHTYEFWATDDFAPVKNRAWVQVGWPGNDCHVEYMERSAPEPQRLSALRSSVQRSRISVFRDYSPVAGGNQGVDYSMDSGWGLRRFNDASVDAPDPYGYPLKSHEASTNADIANLANLANPDPVLSLRKLPSVDPVLTAHPFFGLPGREGGITRPLPDNPEDPASWWGISSSSNFRIFGGYMENDFPNNTFFDGNHIGANNNAFSRPVDVLDAGPNPPWKYTNDDTILPNFANIWNETALSPFRGGKWTGGTKYTFRINYWHSQNVAPQFIRVWIRRNVEGQTPGSWQSYTMEKHNPLDTTYTDGCVYQYQATPDQLPEYSAADPGGSYNYYFSCNDGTRTCIFPNRPDQFAENNRPAIDDPGDPGVPSGAEGQDYYWFRVNRAPTLADEGRSVSPVAGKVGDNFTFAVKYTDPDGQVQDPATPGTGDRPFRASLFIDLFGDELGQSTVTAISSDTTLQYRTEVSGEYYAAGSLAGYQVSMQSGPATRKSYTIADNTGSQITLAAGSTAQTDGVAAGNTFHVANWKESTMSKEDPADDDYTDGVWYVYNTGTNLTLDPGTHHYYFLFCDDWATWNYPDQTDVKVEGEYVRLPYAGEFEGPEVNRNTAPQLVDYRFVPDAASGADGSAATPLTFYVTYMDAENDPPSFIRMQVSDVGGTNNVMVPLSPLDAGDTVYSDGAVYMSQPTRLPEGQHVIKAQASDGVERYPPGYPANQTLPFKGPRGRVLAVNAAALTVTYELDSGTPFATGALRNLGITAQELDATPAPIGAELTIIDNTRDSADPSKGTLTFATGTTLTLTTNDNFIFSAAPGPNVAANRKPQLVLPSDDNDESIDPATGRFVNPPGLTPDNGRGSTTFTYTIIYVDDDQYAGLRGNPPAYVRVYIDGVQHDMTKVDANDTDYTTSGGGAEYRFTIDGATLGQGTAHTYFFLASDGLDIARRPAQTATPNNYTGPRVDDPPPPPQQLTVVPTPNVNGGSLDYTFNASLDDGGGANDVTEYHLYRNTSATFAGLLPVKIIPATKSASYSGQDTTVTGVVTGERYFYMVRAYDGTPTEPDPGPNMVFPDGSYAPLVQSGATVPPIDSSSESVDSNVDPSGPEGVAAVDSIAPQPPSNLQAIAETDGTIALSWTLSPDDGFPVIEGGITQYHLYRNETGAPFAGSPLATILAGESSYVDTTAVIGTGYYYVLRAFDGTNESVNSNVTDLATSQDLQGPQITNLDPAADAVNVPRNTTIEFDVLDNGSGPDRSTFSMQVNGTPVTPELGTGTKQFHVTYTPPTPFAYFATVAVGVEIDDLSGNKTTTNYQFTITGPPTYTVSGTILQGTTPVPGVTVRVGLQSAVTAADGTYTVTGLAAGTYDVIPSLEDFSFAPESRSVTLGPGSATGVDFAAAPGYDIVVTITDVRTGGNFVGARVTDGQHEAIVNAQGQYVIKNIAAGTYTVAAEMANFVFTPAQVEVTVGPPDGDAAVAMSADIVKYTISGNVRTSAGVRLAGVAVEARALDGTVVSTAVTSDAGAYTINDVPGGSYNVVPALAGYVFEPESEGVQVAGDRSDVDFVAVSVHRVALATGLGMVAFPVLPRNLNPVANMPAGVSVWRWDPTAVPPGYLRGVAGTLPDQMSMDPGRSWWLQNTTGAAVNIDVPGDPVDTSRAFTLQLEQGWNMAGNMLKGDLAWSNLAITPGERVRDYGYIYNPANGSYQLVTGTVAGSDLVNVIGAVHVIPQNAGFWIKSDVRRTVQVSTVIAADADTAAAPEPKFTAGDYLVPIVAKAAGRADVCSVAGIVAENDGSYTMDNPPAVSPYVDLYFEGEGDRRLAWDVRSSAAGTASWNFVVATDIDGATVEVSLPDLSMVPNDKAVYLVDQATGKRVYARTVQTYSYAADEGGQRRFTLEVAPKTNGSLVVTGASAVETGQGVALSYVLAQPAQVTVQVTNVAGRTVRTLGTGTVAAAGANTAVWNLCSDSGTRVPRGRYLLRVTAAAEDGQQNTTMVSVQVKR